MWLISFKNPNIMKKLLAVTLTVIGLVVDSNAQTLLYQWAFTNATDTVSNSAASYAITPGTGNLIIQNVAGNVFGTVGSDTVNPVLYFTNSTAGPGSGPGVDANGAFVANGQGYNGGSTAVALATNLNLGTLPQFTVTYWVQFGITTSGQFNRLVQFGAEQNYDAGAKGSVFNGVGSAINYPAGAGTGFQNGLGNSSANFNTTVSVTNTFPFGLDIFDQVWYFVAITYDGTLTFSNYTTWVGSSTQPLQTVDVGPITANYGPIAFTTNATILIGNDNNGSGTPRGLSTGLIADVRIYSGILTSNSLNQIQNFQVPSLLPPNPLSPTIGAQPASGNSFVGESRSFSVGATGNPNTFTYLWRSNGVPISGATNSSISISNIQLAANGSTFVCSVTNLVGGTNSLPATLTVLPVTSSSYAAAVLANNPYSLWLINESSNTPSFAIYDYVSGNDGVALDPGNMTFAGGPAGLGFYGFPTTNTSIGTIRGTGPSRLNLKSPVNYVNNGMTIVGWVYAPGYGGGGNEYNALFPQSYGMIFSLANDVGQGFGLFFGDNIANGAGPGLANGNGSEVDYQWGTTAPPTFNSGLFMNTNEWTFVALVISTNSAPDTNATIYIGSESLGLTSTNDSTAATGDEISGGSSLAPLVLGRNTFSGSENQAFPYLGTTSSYNGVAVFYSALSPNAIANLFLSGVGLHLQGGRDPSIPGNLLLNWSYGYLQSSVNVAGPYLNVPGTTNGIPYSIPITGNSQFYRLSPTP